MPVFVRNILFAALVGVIASCEPVYQATSINAPSSKCTVKIPRQTSTALVTDKPLHHILGWRTPIIRTHSIPTPRPFPTLITNDPLGIYYEPADPQPYIQPMYLLKPYFRPITYTDPENHHTKKTVISKMDIRKEKLPNRRNDKNEFRESLNGVPVFLDISVDNSKTKDASGVEARTRIGDMNEVENIFLNCMDLELALIQLEPDNLEKLYTKTPWNKDSVNQFRTPSELMSEIQVICKDPEQTIRANVKDIMEASKVSSRENRLPNVVKPTLKIDVGRSGMASYYEEPTDDSEIGEGLHKETNVISTDNVDKLNEPTSLVLIKDGKIKEKRINDDTHTQITTLAPTEATAKMKMFQHSEETELETGSYDYISVSTTPVYELPTREYKVTLVNIDSDMDSASAEIETATEDQIYYSTVADSHQNVTASNSMKTAASMEIIKRQTTQDIANYDNKDTGSTEHIPSTTDYGDAKSSDFTQTTTAQYIRATINEASVKIPKIENHELRNGSVISKATGFESLPNTDFIAEADIKAPSKSKLIEIITGRMVFLHNNKKIPLLYHQNSNGFIELAIDGNYLCDHLMNSLDNSTMLAALCNISD